MAFYKRRTYENIGTNILHLISKANFVRNIEVTEKVTYEVYHKIVAFHKRHRDITKLYVLRMPLEWIEVELIIN